MLFEPQLPYTYLPKTEFTNFKRIIGSFYSDIKCSNSLKGACYWEKTCDKIKDTKALGYIDFKIGDNFPNHDDFKIHIEFEDLLIPGAHIG